MQSIRLAFKVLSTIVMVLFIPFVSVFLLLLLGFSGCWEITAWMSIMILPMAIPLIWLEKRKIYGIIYGVYVLIIVILLATQWGIETYNKSITIDTAPSINVEEYLPFRANSKIVKQYSRTLSFEALPRERLPIIDGAAALFPVYSAYVHAVYPQSTELYDGVFEYYNTVTGYQMLAEKTTELSFHFYRPPETSL